MKIILLGTSGSIPTATRSLPAVAVRREKELLLFDCGEGTQVQMTRAGLSPLKISSIFITHLHGDHFLGLAGLIQTMALLGRSTPLRIYCPLEDRERLWEYIKIPRYSLTFDVSVGGLRDGGEIEMRGYRILARRALHPVPSLAYALVEDKRPGRFYPDKAESLGVRPGPDFSKLQAGEIVRVGNRVVRPEDVMGPPRSGRKIVYTGDTRPCDEIVKLASGANVLIHDSTFSDDLRDKAAENSHSTSREAAETAREARAELLVLFHISPRYTDTSQLLKDAAAVFENVTAPSDLDEINIPLRR
ncbi:MAG: ribonuclease Z [Candidatus Hadarchaeales archaeon]